MHGNCLRHLCATLVKNTLKHITYNNVQHGRQSLKCNAAQLVLKYLMLHKNLLCNTWRGRLYYYSSGTTFSNICSDLQHFLDNEPRGLKSLPKLKDVGMLRELVADVIVNFIAAKPTFFKDAMLSKEHFWQIPMWKRALIFVFMCRFVCGKKGTYVMSIFVYKHLLWSYKPSSYISTFHDLISQWSMCAYKHNSYKHL